MNHILDQLQEEKSKIAEVFKGTRQSRTRCDTCIWFNGMDQNTFMWALSMQNWAKPIQEATDWTTSLQLLALIKEFTLQEKLRGAKSYNNCQTCKSLVQATLEYSISGAP